MIAPPAIMLGVPAVVPGAQVIPRAFAGSGGEIDIILPASVLHTPGVRKQLVSGLTTVFVASFEEKGIRGGARVEVRYELWDEMFLVAVIDGDGKRREAVLPSYERLVDWWCRTQLRMVTHPSAVLTVLHLKLEAVPFSAGEQADAQRWLRQSIGEHETPGVAGPRPSRQTPGGLLDVIIGTSVQRRPILAVRWTVSVEGDSH